MQIACPNKSSKEWIELVSIIGEDNAYKEYIRNGEEIPDPTKFAKLKETSLILRSGAEELTNEEVYNSFEQKEVNLQKTFSDIILPGFTAYTQNEAVNLLTEQALIQIKLTPGVTLNQALQNVVEEAKEIDPEVYKPIIDNISALREFVKDKLDRIGLLDSEYLADENNLDIEGDTISDTFYWKDDWVFKFDSKANAQKKIKEFLLFIPKTVVKDGVYNYVVNEFNTTSFMPYDIVFEELKGLLSNVPNTWEDMSNVLRSSQEGKPWIYALLNEIDNYPEVQQRLTGKVGDKQQLINQFVTTFSSSYSGSKTLLKVDKAGGIDFRIIDTDQNSIEKGIINRWKSFFNTTKFIKINEEGNQVGDIERINKFIEQIDAAQNNSNQASDVLHTLGIELSPETIKQLITGTIGGLSYDRQFTASTGLFKIIKSRLTGKDANDLDGSDVVNPIVNNSAIKALARVEAENNNSIYSNSYQNGEGNIVYSYSLNKFMTKQFNKLTNDLAFLQQLSSITFHAPIFVNNQPLYKTWLWELQNNSQFAKTFDLAPFDTLKESDQPGTPISAMGDIDLEITKLQLFQNRNRWVRGAGRISNYLFTVPSKTTSYVITGGAINPNISVQGNDFKLGSDVRNALYSIALTELKRINSIHGRQITTNKYKNGSKYFYFFPILNKDTSPELWNSDGTVKLPSTKVDNTTVEQIIKSKIEAIIKQEIKDKVDYWKSTGIIDINNKLKYVDKKYKSNLKGDDNYNNLFTAADYIINNSLAEFNIHQLFIGDPAIYFKNNVDKTWDEIGKRLAAMIAPGRDPSLTSQNETFLSVKLKDREGNIALNIAELKQRLGEDALPYENLNGTDAQEFTTVKEHITVLYKYGQITTDTYRKVIDYIEANGSSDGLELTKAELGVVLQPMKPVYVSSSINSNEDVVSLEYVKSSSIPLVASFTKGLELDKLRKALEKLESKTGSTVRAVYDSATKVGGISSIDIFNEDGSIKSNLDFTNYYKELPRNGFSIQQDVPYDPNVEEVVKASQSTKLIFDGLLNVKGFNYKGEELTGSQLQSRYDELHRRLFERSKDKLSSEILGVDGQLDIPKLQKVLLTEARKRGWSPAEQAMLSITPDNQFEYPLWIGGKKFEALLTSLYTNNIIRQQLHGKSYVLVSEEGTKGRSSAVVYTPSYDPKVGLKPMRIENGVVKGAQVLVPWKFKYDINKFTTSDGLIDTSLLPEGMLEQFSFRIPNQGHTSMSLIEVVGYLPQVMGDVVIASRNFITQMGSDFDVDKLYVYDYYNKLEDEKIVKDNTDETTAIKNELVDIYKTVLKNPDPKVFNAVVKPIGNTKDTESAQYLKKLLQRKFNNYLSPDYKKTKYLESVDGKSMVGIEALANTLNPILQQHDHKIIKVVENTEIIDGIVFTDDKGKKLDLSNLSSPYTWKGNTKNSIISADLSAAVDNEKDPILYYINSNPITAPARIALRQVGFEHDHINYLTAQPVIRDFVSRVQQNRSVVGGKFVPPTLILYSLIEEVEARFLSTATIAQKEGYNRYALQYMDLSAEELKANIKKQDSLINLAALLKFTQAYNIGSSLQSIQRAINVESSGVGRTIIELKSKAARTTDLLKIKNISNVHKVIGEFTGKGLQPNTYSGYILSNGLLEANKRLGDSTLFKYNSRSFNHILSEYTELIGDISDDRASELWENVKAYIFATNYSVEERKRIFFGKESLAKRIKAYLTTKEGRKNQFLIRLNLEFKGGNNPDLISYNAAKEEFVDDIGVYQGFLDLIVNKDLAVRSIGQDLITYFYINGGSQKAREWGRYIHPNFLKEGIEYVRFINTNFQDLNTIGYTGDAPYTISSMMMQYIQHRPWLAKTINPEAIKEGKIRQGNNIITLPPVYSGDFQLLTKPSGFEYYPILSVKDAASPKGYRLYVFNSLNDDGSVNFRLAPTLGTTNFVEYSGSSVGLSLVNPNYNYKKGEVIAPVKNVPINDTKSIPNDEGIAYQMVGNVHDVLNKIETNKEFAKILKEFNPVGEIKVDTSINAAGEYKPTTKIININPAKIRKGSGKERAQIERIILHEVTHLVTVEALRGRGNLNAKQKAAVDRINTIYNGLLNQLNADTLEGFKLSEYMEFQGLLKRYQKNIPLTKVELDRFVQLRPVYYGFSQVEEFVAEIMTSEQFYHKLNNLKWDNNTSIIDRIIQLITDFLNALGAKEGSVTFETVKSVLELIPEKTDKPKKSPFAFDQPPPDITDDMLNSPTESMGNEYIKLINEFRSRLSNIDESISKAFISGDKVRAEKLLARKEEVQGELRSLEENKVFSTILSMATKDLDNVEKIFQQPGLSHNDINYTARVIHTWLNGSELVLEPQDILDNNQRVKDMDGIQARANNLYRRWSNIARTSLLKAVQETSGIEGLTTEVIDTQNKINAITANLMDISRTGNILLSVMDKWMRESTFKANLETQKVEEEVERLSTALHSDPLFQKEGYYLFAQRTKEGDLTGEMVQALKADYYLKRNGLIQDASDEPNKTIKRAKWKNYFKWVRDNHIIVDIRKLYKQENDGTYSYSPNESYLAQLQNKFGDRYNEYLQEQKDKITYYNERLQTKIASLDSEDPNNFRELEKWKAKNDPSIYLRGVLSDEYSATIIDGEYIKNEGQEYVFKRANEEWVDDQYKVIQNSEVLKAFYDYSIKTLNRLYSYVPSNYKQFITTRTIPNIPKSLMETYNEQGMPSAFTHAGNSLIKSISVNDLESQTNKVQNPVTGVLENKLYVRYILNTLTEEEKSYDLGKVIKAFALEAYSFKHKSTVEDSVRLAYSILQNSVESVKNPNGRNLIDRFGERTTIKGNKNLIDQTEHAIDAWYGNRKDLQGVTNKKVYTNKARSKVRIVKEAVKSNNYTDEVNKLINSMFDSLRESEQLKINEIRDEATKNTAIANAYLAANERYVAGSKVGDVLLQYMQLKGMGFNIFSSVTNVVFGWFSNFNYASGNRDFSTNQMLKANRIMLASTGNSVGASSATAHKIRQMMERFDVLKELNDAAYRATTNTNKIRKGIEKIGPYELQRRGEYFVQGQTMVALALNTKVKIGDKAMTLWEAWDTKEFHENVDWNGNIDNKTHNAELYKFKFKLDQINKTIHGNYDPNSAVRIKKGILGRALMQFRSWIAEGFASRVESNKYDLLLGRQREGRWRTYYNLGFKKSLQILLRTAANKNIDGLVDGEYKFLVEENMKRNLAELYTKGALIALYFVLKHLDFDDDDEWNKKAANFTLNQLLRLQDDIEFYYSPMAIENITQNFVPVFTLIRDGAKFIDATEKGIVDGEWEYKSGKKRGENRMLWTGLKLFPFSSSLATFINKTENEETFRK